MNVLFCYLMASTFMLYSKLNSLNIKLKAKNFIGNLRNAKPSIKSIDWLSIVVKSMDSFDNIKRMNIDLSAGAYTLSMPENNTIYVHEPVQRKLKLFSMDGKTNITITPTDSPILRVHQFSRRFLRKLPDSALLGLLTLSSLELIQRQLKSDTFVLPPLLKEAANISTENLNTKLEILSSMSWNLDPFVRAEVDAMQAQPLEVVENFIINDLLPRLDKDLSPILLKMIADPSKISIVTRAIKQFVNETAAELRRSGADVLTEPLLPLDETALKIAENVDKVGNSFEEVAKLWNRGLEDVGKLTKGENWYGYVRGLLSNVTESTTSALLPKRVANIARNSTQTQILISETPMLINASPLHTLLPQCCFGGDWVHESVKIDAYKGSSSL